MTTNRKSHSDNGRLPPIHIMAGGMHALPYARFAVECLWHKCPEALRKNLKVHIGLFAVPNSLLKEAEVFFKEVPCVSILLNPVWVPLRIYSLPQGYTRHRIRRVLTLLRKSFDRLGLPPAMQIRLCPMIQGHLANYLQEYLIRVCHLYKNYPSVCILDADFFIWDEQFFDKLSGDLPEDVFISSWLKRSDDGAEFQGKTFYPSGSECMKINPTMFNQWNWQVETLDEPAQKRLQKRYSQIKFQRRMVDTAYQACWEAQFAGMKIEYPFKEIKVCHVGGFGHANTDYIRDCLQGNNPDGEKAAQFWIQRIRLNERVAETLAQRFSKNWITAGLENIHRRTRPIWEDEILRNLEKRTPPSGDEILFEEIARNVSL